MSADFQQWRFIKFELLAWPIVGAFPRAQHLRKWGFRRKSVPNGNAGYGLRGQNDGVR